MVPWISVVLCLAVVPLGVLGWWFRLRVAAELNRPRGIYERVESLLARQPVPMEDDVRERVEVEADRDFRSALEEMGIDPEGCRLVLRDDELLEVAPWVVHADGREELLSAFEGRLRREAARVGGGAAG